jgi:hypothetical protein
MADVLVRKIQDKFRPLKQLQQNIEKATGRRLPQDEQPYLVEQFFTGKLEQDFEDAQR